MWVVLLLFYFEYIQAELLFFGEWGLGLWREYGKYEPGYRQIKFRF